MIVWKDLLQPITVKVHHRSTLREVMQTIHTTQSELVLVYAAQKVVGYLNTKCVMQFILAKNDLDQPIPFYYTDVLLVREDQPVEFYHNVSVVLGVNQANKVTGFCSLADARNQITRLQLKEKTQIFNSAHIGVITTNEQFRITFINGTAENILGLSRNFLLHRNYKTLLNAPQLEDVLLGKQLVSVSHSLNFKQIIGNFSPLFNEGKILGIIHIFYLREQLEESIQELEWVRNLNEDLKALYSSSNEEIIVLNGEGKIVRLAGDFLKDFWGVEHPDELIGKNLFDMHREGLYQYDLFERAHKKKGKFVFVHENKKGCKVWSSATPVFYQDKLEKIVMISRDITEINQLREELKIERKRSDQYKQELDQMMMRNQVDKKLIYRSKVMEDVVDQIKRIAMVDSTVLLYGESGVGKEVFAQTIHQNSRRKEHPLVRVNCGAIPESLIESEFFGYVKGAFTGADQNGRAGFFEQAHQGTIFLDEITELPLNLQVKLLRVLQEKEVMRIGDTKSIKVDVRVIAATNRNIKRLVEENKFREDLYYRLNVIPVHIPPLRERTGDVMMLSLFFLEQFNRLYQLDKKLSQDAFDVLESYHWPGNVRELQNMIERLVVTSRGQTITGEEVMSILFGESKSKVVKPILGSIMPLQEAVDDLESQLIRAALQKYGTAAKAAKVLQVSPATMSRKINRLLR